MTDLDAFAASLAVSVQAGKITAAHAEVELKRRAAFLVAKSATAFAAVEPRGPGTELKKLLAGFPLYIKTTPGCKCNERAKHMDRMGCDWCEQNIDTIVGWLKEEHENRKVLLPFSENLASVLVKRAIAKARKANSK